MKELLITLNLEYGDKPSDAKELQALQVYHDARSRLSEAGFSVTYEDFRFGNKKTVMEAEYIEYGEDEEEDEFSDSPKDLLGRPIVNL